MAKQINVDVQERRPGKKYVKMTREKNLVPVVIYGNGKENEFGAIEDLAFRKNVLAHEHALFSLNYKGKTVSAVVRNLDIDYLNRKIVHADFYAVNMNEKIDATVTIRFIGEAVGVSEGGVLNKALEELHVFCLPADIPNDIEIDVSALNIHDHITVADLKLPANVEILHEMDQTVCAVAVKAEEPEEEVEVVAAAAEAAPASGTAPAAPAPKTDEKAS